MANTDQILLQQLEAINNKLDNLAKVQQEQGGTIIRLEEGQKRLENGQAHTNTALEAVQAGQEDVREYVRKNVATKLDVDVVEKSLKVDIYDLRAKVITIDAKFVRKVQITKKDLMMQVFPTRINTNSSVLYIKTPAVRQEF